MKAASVGFAPSPYLSTQVAQRPAFRQRPLRFDVTPPLQLVGEWKAASQDPPFATTDLIGGG